MAMIDLQFPVLGSSLPADHGYGLYSALSRVLPALHDKDCPMRVAPIPGQYAGNGMLSLDARRSRLRLRLPAESIPVALPLAGKSLDVDGHKIRLGVPQVRALVPAPALIARLVTIKGFTEPGPFLDACRRQLDALGIKGEPDVPLIRAGSHEGKTYRRVLRIKQRRVVGFTVLVSGLAAPDSLKLQERGLGGRRRMGCGFFVPVRQGGSK